MNLSIKSVHRYPSTAQFNFWCYNLLAFSIIVLGLFVGFHSAFKIEIDQVLYSLLILFVGLFLLFSAHYYSEIISDEDGLLVQFCFWHLRVRWDDMIRVKLVPMKLLMNPLLSYYSGTHYVVEVRALTPIHRFYGIYLNSFQPSFVFHSNISNFKELFSGIENKGQMNRNPLPVSIL